MTTTFGALVRQRRRALDLTQAELARRTGFAAITIRRIESGERRPSRELVTALARALDVPDHETEAFSQLGRRLVGDVPPATVTLSGTPLARLQPPLRPAHWVPRTDLERRLDEIVRATLTTVVAAPGFGKTATLATWAERTSDVAWLTLSPAQSQLDAMVGALVDAVRLQVPGLPASAGTAARFAGPHGAETARADAQAAQLLWSTQERLASRSLTIVLDDVDQLQPGCQGHALLEALVRQAPANLHVVVLSRAEVPFPVSRLRLTGRLNEIGPDLLAFDVADVASLLRLRLGPSGADLAAAVFAATDGWPAATRLVADALAAIDERHRDDAVARMTRRGPELATFLTQEVLSTLPGQHLSALTVLAALPAFDATLAGRLGIPDSGSLIQDLRARGLVRARPLGDTFEAVGMIAAYAAHSDSLEAPRRRAAFRAAAEWFLSRGEGESGLALLTRERDGEALAALLARTAAGLVTAGHTSAVLDAAEVVPPHLRTPTVEEAVGQALLMAGRWEESLECMRRAATGTATPPRIARWTGVVHHLRGDLTAATAIYAATLGASENDPDVAIVRAMHASAVWVQGDLPQARELASRAWRGARECADPTALAAAHTVLAMIAAGDGDRRANDVHDRLALENAQRAGDALQVVRIRSNRGSHLIETAQYQLALEELTAAVDLAEVTGFAPFLALARTNRGEALTALGRHEEAVTEYLAAAELYDRIDSRLIVFPLLSLAELFLLRGEVAQAVAHAERVLERGAGDGPHMIRVRAQAALARLVHQADPDRARALAAQVLQGADGMVAVQGRLAAGWVALADGEAEHAHALAEDAGELAQVRRDAAGFAESCELAALSSPERQNALERIAEAVTEWERAGDSFRAALAELVHLALLGNAAGVQNTWARLRRRGLRDGAAAVAGPLGTLTRGRAPTLPEGPQGLVEPRVRVCLFGSFRLYLSGTEAQADRLTAPAWALLALLAGQRGRPVACSEAEDALPAAPRLLERVLEEVRDLLDQGAGLERDWYLAENGDGLALDTDRVDLDADRFLREADRLLARTPVEDLEQLAALEASYTGDIPSNGSAAGDGLREECRAAYLGVLRRLACGHSELGDHEEAVRYSLRLLTHDPSDEGAALALVETLEASGRYGEARRHYRQYTARMRVLGIEPAPFPQREGARGQPSPRAPK